MSDRRFTQEEFEELLKRAAERDVRTGPRTFSKGDLVTAGQELGLASETIEEVWREREERERRPAVPRVPRPHDTRLSVEAAGGVFCLRYGQKLLAKAVALGACAFAGFIAAYGPGFWAGAPPPLAYLMALVPSAIAALATWMGFHQIELTLWEGGGRLVKGLGPVEWKRHLDPRQLSVRLDEAVTAQDNQVRRVPFLALDHGTKTHKLLVGYSVPEQRWMMSEIDLWLRANL